MKKVSVIVPCYNQSEYLPETLDSVLSQTYKDWECVIVNDGSSDDTEKIALDYCKKDKRFKYVFQNNQGVSEARNNGINVSCGYYILPLDGDDIIEATYLEKAVKYIEENPSTKLVYCKVKKIGAIDEYWDLPVYEYENMLWESLIFCSALYKREDYEKTCGYNSNMKYGLEDWDFYLSLLSKDDFVYRINEVLFFYRIKDISRSTILHNGNHVQESLVTLYNNHKEKYAPYINNIVYLKRMAKKGESYENVLKSNSYRLGNFLLSPFILLKRLINKSK